MVLQINPKNLDGINLLAVIHANEGNIETAILLFERATLISPKNATAHFNLGRALDDAGVIDRAIESYRCSLKINPHRVDGHINLGSLLIETEDFESAADHFQRAIKIDPDNALAYSNLGSVWKNIGQLEKSASSCIRAIAINSSLESAHFNLACVYLEMARITDAVNSFQDTLNLNSNHLEAWNGLEISAKVEGCNAWKNHLSVIARSTIYFEVLEYSLMKLRPHEAKGQFQKAMAAFHSINDEELHETRELTTSESSCQLPKNMIALFHFGRSGTGLFQSLIDGHPEISSLPSIYCRGFFNPGVWKSISQDGWQGLPERFVNKFAVLFDASSPKSTPRKLYEVSSSLGIREGMTSVGEGRDEVLSVDK